MVDYPNPPSKRTSYTARAQAQGDGSLPGQEMDVDYDAIFRFLSGLSTFLKQIVNPDGSLANQIVRRENLSSEILIGFEAATTWEAGAGYTKNATVFRGARFYISREAHVASPDFDSDLVEGKWELLLDLSPAGALSAGNNLSEIEDAAAARLNLGLGPRYRRVPEHYGAVGNGVVDDTIAMQAFVDAGGGHLSDGATYLVTGLAIPDGCTIHNASAVIRYEGGGADAVLTIGAATIDRLIYTASAQIGGDGDIQVGNRARIGSIEATADTQMDGNMLVVLGDDVHIGDVVTSRFGRPFVLGSKDYDTHRLRVGSVDLAYVIRAIAINRVDGLFFGDATVRHRSANNQDEAPGRNSILTEGCMNAVFGDLDLEDATEHSIRFGGSNGMPTKNITFGDVTIRRASASSIKLNTGVDTPAENIHFGNVHVIDPCFETGAHARASHIIRVSHAKRVSFGAVHVSPDDRVTDATVITLADCSHVHFGEVSAAGCEGGLILFDEDQDWDGAAPYGGFAHITVGSVAFDRPETGATYPVRFETPTVAVRHVDIGGMTLSGLDGATVGIADLSGGGTFENLSFRGYVTAGGGAGSLTPNSFKGAAGAVSVDVSIAGKRMVGDPRYGRNCAEFSSAAKAFGPQDGGNWGVAVTANGTGSYGGALSLTGPGSTRRRAAFAAVSDGSADNEIAAAVFTGHPSVVGTDGLRHHTTFHHNGDLEIENSDATLIMHSSDGQAWRIRVRNDGTLSVNEV